METTGKMRNIDLIKRVFGVVLITFVVYGCTKEDVQEEYDMLKQMEIDREIIEDYIAENELDATEISFNDAPSGVFYFNHIIADPNDTEKPQSSSEITVAYKGYLLDGTVFDSTAEGNSVSFILNGLIPGWQLGIPVMSKGDKISLIIPSPYGYGPYGGGSIPANSVLIFDINLINFTN